MAEPREKLRGTPRERADAIREEGEEGPRQEALNAPYEGDIDPASMVISPQAKPKIESETKIIGAYAGDPRSISPLAVDTETEGTETPWRDTPPTNISSVHETNNDQSPPTDPGASQEDCDAMLETEVPPEGEIPEDPPVELRSALEVFPPERDADMEPPRPRRSDKTPEAVELTPAEPKSAEPKPAPDEEPETERETEPDDERRSEGRRGRKR